MTMRNQWVILALSNQESTTKIICQVIPLGVIWYFSSLWGWLIKYTILMTVEHMNILWRLLICNKNETAKQAEEQNNIALNMN